jgi:hypothetical protein
MVLYKCPRCNYNTKKKADIRKHFIRKNPCKIKNVNICQDECQELLKDDKLESVEYLKLEIEKGEKNEQELVKTNTMIKEQMRALIKYNTQLLSRITLLEKQNIPKNALIKSNTQLVSRITSLENQNVNPGIKVQNQFIYILKEREFVKSNEEIYKIGKTRSLTNRIGDYPKGSKLKLIYPCEGMDTIEKELLLLFDEKFIRMVDVGREYFRGDLNVMVNLVTNHIASKTSETVELQ